MGCIVKGKASSMQALGFKIYATNIRIARK